MGVHHFCCSGEPGGLDFFAFRKAPYFFHAHGSLPARTKLVHGVGQLAGVALPVIALLLELLALGGRLLLTLVDNPKSDEPGQIGHDQHEPEYFELHDLSPVHCVGADERSYDASNGFYDNSFEL